MAGTAAVSQSPAVRAIVSAWRRSRAQSTGGCGSGTPGRLRGTRTRSASGRIVQRTGVGIRTDSPSMPTGICGGPRR